MSGLHTASCLIWTSEDTADECDCGTPDPNAQEDPDVAHDSRVSQLLADEARRGAA